ncbi:MAG TPA: hypothetical protein LFV92_05710 [Rickettsia endosymbiont of Ceroptres masudai]|nr:hypothetical protein [Rickettsia endosymbiont of Ceroptres masudai]
MANGLTLPDVERFFRHCEEALPAWIPWSSHGMTAKSAGFPLFSGVVAWIKKPTRCHPRVGGDLEK